MENNKYCRRFYINNCFWALDLDDFLYLSNYWAAWLEDYDNWELCKQEKRQFANCDEFVLQSLYEDRENRKNILIDETI